MLVNTELIKLLRFSQKQGFTNVYTNYPRVGMNTPSHALSGHVTNVSNQASYVENSHRNQRTRLRTSKDEHRHISNMANDMNLTKPGFMLKLSDPKQNIRATNVKTD